MATVPPAAPPPAAAPRVEAPPQVELPPGRNLGEPIGAFRFTMYYVAQEDAYPQVRPESAASPEPASSEPILASSGVSDISSGEPDSAPDGEPALVEKTALPPRTKAVTLLGRDCQPIAQVWPGFAKQLRIQGTGQLRDGRILNTAGAGRCNCTPCYKEVQDPLGMGSNGRLIPFRSVAIDTALIKRGTMLYLPELDGLRMPGTAPWGGYVHDGCVLADDVGGGIKGRELDFFVSKKTYSNSLSARHRIKRVTVFDGKGWCERKGRKVRKSTAM